jgi:SAM-dependent methyltransferase
MDTTGPNAEQIRYWNDAGPKWVSRGRLLDAQLAPLGREVMDRAAIAPGAAVLDVGCGCGETTVELAARVGPTGTVTGVDVSAPMLEAARARAAGLPHVRFVEADAQTHRFSPASQDLLFSRFGVMFFTDPAAAFANLRAALRPEGRVAFICWQPLGRNDWLRVPLLAALQHLPPPPPPAPDAPGPFAFGDPERVRDILARAGFDHVALEPLETTLTVGGGGSIDEAVEFLLELGPAGALLRDADPALRPAVAASVRAAILPFAGPGGVRMPGAAWIVTARRTV